MIFVKDYYNEDDYPEDDIKIKAFETIQISSIHNRVKPER